MSVESSAIPAEVTDMVRAADWITVFSGAGMSAESGIPTFRDARTGLWENFDPTTLATPQAWNDDPALVWGWYQWRAGQVRRREPNAGHRALGRLAGAGVPTGHDPRAVMVVTQNVDDLHERAGTPVTSHLHGSLFTPRCSACGRPHDQTDPVDVPDPEQTGELPRVAPPACRYCGCAVRPGVVWFGEPLPERDWTRADAAFRATDLVLVVGTSGIVYPAASLPERAATAGIPVIEINPEPSALTPHARYRIAAGAAVALPALVGAVTGNR
ncbi:SIR2 family NAD-dependent protein deacylase [Gordonia sp. DT30]|uniref:SIR2 family NAD-dependent protein deacylase n=1 Tax=unclassified Gordonia (in: high G+C Gram-positive bacteria) TaxID=2657482 RepID=UPI003CF79C43